MSQRNDCCLKWVELKCSFIMDKFVFQYHETNRQLADWFTKNVTSHLILCFSKLHDWDIKNHNPIIAYLNLIAFNYLKTSYYVFQSKKKKNWVLHYFWTSMYVRWSSHILKIAGFLSTLMKILHVIFFYSAIVWGLCWINPLSG